MLIVVMGGTVHVTVYELRIPVGKHGKEVAGVGGRGW